MRRKTIIPLFSPADEAAVRPILEALRAKGFAVSEAAAARKKDPVLLFLSAAFAADGALQERFFAAEDAGAAVIPVDLDGAAQPELIRSALMARSAILAQDRTPEEIAARVASAEGFGEKGRPKRLGRALLAAAALLMLGAALWLWKSAPARAEKREKAEILLTARTKYGLSEEDLAEIECAYFISDRFYYCKFEDADSFRWDFASCSMEDDGMHWFDSRSGERLYPAAYSAEDLAILRLMPKLEGFDLILVEAEALPDLSTSTTLNWIELVDSSIRDISGLAGSSLGTIHCFRCPIEDYSVLTDCEQLAYATMEFDFQEKADLSGFSPPALQYASFGCAPQSAELDLSGLKNCTALEELKIENIPCGPPEGDGPSVTDLDFLAGLPHLKKLTVESMSLLTDVSALGTLPALEELRLNDCPELADVSALANASALRELRIENCAAIRGFSPLGGCRALEKLCVHSDELRDASFLSALPSLRDIDLAFRRLPNVDFLADIPADGELRLELYGDVADFSALAARERYDYLLLAPNGGSADAALAYLRDATVDHFRLDGCRIEDLGAFPRVTDALELWYCELGDLSTLPAWPVKDLNLVGLSTLTSLRGIEKLPTLEKGGSLILGVQGCPHLKDWSALDGRTLRALRLADLNTLPELGSIYFSTLRFERCEALTDLHFLDAKPEGWKYDEISLLEQDGLRELSPLRRLRGRRLIVGPELADQAEELAAEGAVEDVEIRFPEGIWHFADEDIKLLELGELETLSPSLLGRVRELCLVGGLVVDTERYEIEESGGAVALRDRESGEVTELKPEGGLRDLSVLAPLTGLQRLTLLNQPLEDLEGIQHLGALEALDVRSCPELADVSAAFTLQSLRSLTVVGCPVASIEGIRNLTALRELQLSHTAVDDLSVLPALPSLERVRLSEDMKEEAAGLGGQEYGFALEIEGDEHE